MTSPENVGVVEVEILADAKLLATSIREGVESAFKGLDFDKLIRDSLGGKPIKVPVKPEFDDKDLPKTLPRETPESTPKTTPTGPKQKVPVEVDPLFDAFRQQLRRETSALAKEIHASVPVDADTAGLRGELGAQLAEIAKQLKLAIPAEPGDKAAFQAKLQEQVDEVRARVKAQVKVDADTSGIPEKVKETPVPKVKVEVDPLLAAFQAQVRSQITTLARTANAKVPIGADTSGLRGHIAADLEGLQRSLKAEIPTEPGARAAYEAKLKAQLDEVSHRVKQSVTVEPKGGTADFSGFAGLAGKLTPNLLGGGAISGISSAFQALGGAVSSFGEKAAAGGSELAASLASAAGPVAAIIGGMVAAQAAALALGAAATLLVPAFAAAAGAAAAIPAALAGLGAAGATLSLGFKGISEAFKPAAAGGSPAQQATQQARQVAAAGRQVEAARRGIVAASRSYEAAERSLAAAERGVAAAQRNLVDAEQAVADAQQRAQKAQLAVNQARVDAANDLVDLNLQLKGSRLSEQEATLAVSDALRELNAVKLTGNIPDIEKADLAYQRAQLTLQQNTQQTKELGQQTDAANKKGVEGSDKVQSALQDQHDALEGVHKAQEGVVDAQNGIIDAADSLKSAQDGVLAAADGIKSATDSLASAQDSLAQASQQQSIAAAAAAAKNIKLAASAQKFVDVLKALKPAFEDLRLDVQQRLFDGLDKTVTHMWAAWKDQLHSTLGSFADTFNTFFKNLGSAVSNTKFIGDLAAGAEGFRKGLEKVASSITTGLIPAFGDLSKAAGPFLAQLGGDIAKGLDKFSGFIEKVSKPDKDGTSQLTRFFDRASKALEEIFNTGTLVIQIVGEIIGILVGTQATSGKTSLDSFNDGLEKIRKFLADPAHRKQIADFVNDLRDGLSKFGSAAAKVDGFLTLIEGKKGQAGSVGGDIGNAIIAGILAGMLDAIKFNVKTFVEYFSPFGPFITPIKAALGIHSPSTVFAELGGNLIDGLIVGIGDSLAGLAAFAAQIPGVVIGAVGNAATWLVAHGKNTVIGLINGIGSLFGTLGTYAGNLKTVVVNRLSDAGSWLVNHGRATVSGLINGIGAMLGQLGSWARNLPATISNALSDASSWLFTHGENAIIGLWNGIASLGGWLWNHVVDFVKTHIKDAAKSALGISSPSKVAHEMGTFVGVGLALGLESQGQRVSAAADALSKAALPQVDDLTAGLGSGLDAVLTSSLQASSQQQILIGFKPGMTGDPILDALRQVIDVKHRGDPVAALSRP